MSGASSTVVGVLLSLLLALTSALPVQEDSRDKRQLSPAVRLEDDLRPLLGLYGYGEYTAPHLKRSLAAALKRHISPSMDVEEDMGSLRTLMSVGKRQISYADDVNRELMALDHLVAAGKKRALSPSVDLQHQIFMSDLLGQAGRR